MHPFRRSHLPPQLHCIRTADAPAYKQGHLSTPRPLPCIGQVSWGLTSCATHLVATIEERR